MHVPLIYAFIQKPKEKRELKKETAIHKRIVELKQQKKTGKEENVGVMTNTIKKKNGTKELL